MYSAQTIADYIINWCIDRKLPISNLKLQQLLYFCQLDFAVLLEKRLIQEDFFAYKLGPLIPSIYEPFLPYASSSIHRRQICDPIDPDDERWIEIILAKYAGMRTWDLCAIACEQDPYKYNYLLFGDRAIIPYLSIEWFAKSKNKNFKFL